MKLRDYQLDIINKIKKAFLRGNRSVLLQLPTGSGKTLIASEMTRMSVLKKKTVWFICNRSELIEQTARAFDLMGIDFSFIASGWEYSINKNVYICSIQTLFRRIESIKKKPDFIFWDEAHSIAANTWKTTFEKNKQAFHLLLTATPCRLDGKGFSSFATDLVSGPSVNTLIECGYLCDYRAFAPRRLDLVGINTAMGDYVNKEIAEIVDKPKFTGDAINEYKKHSMGKRNIVFCVNIEHSKHVAQEFNLAGIPAEHIDGSTDKNIRKKCIDDFKLGKIKVLTSVDLLTTGFDVPSIEVVTFLRPTKSRALAIQMMGRGLRVSPGKDRVLFLDHVNMFEYHGLPDDERDWSLDGIKKRNSENEPSVKICSRCYAAMRNTASQCPECGFIIQKKSKEFDILSTSTQDALGEIDKNKVRKLKIDLERANAKSKDQLIQLAVSRGYKHPHKWAHHIYQARQAKKLKK